MTWGWINYNNSLILRWTSPLLQCDSHLSMRTRAGMPPDLKMASSPSRWWERLCRMLAVARVVSMSDVFCMALTTAATICGDCIRARRDASLRVSWFTIIAALFTTTWSQERGSEVRTWRSYRKSRDWIFDTSSEVPGLHRWGVWWALEWRGWRVRRRPGSWWDEWWRFWAAETVRPASVHWSAGTNRSVWRGRLFPPSQEKWLLLCAGPESYYIETPHL